MKRTVYFSAYADHPQKIDVAITNASAKRDKYFTENENIVGEISDEDLKFIQWPSGNQVTVVLQVSYYERDEKN
jgi:hypothetical protein